MPPFVVSLVELTLASRLLTPFQEIHCGIKNLSSSKVRQTLPNLCSVSLG